MTKVQNELRVDLPKVHGIAFYPPGATFGPRLTRDFEFVWIIEGDAVYHCDGVDHPAPKGSVILCTPGLRDAFTWDAGRPTRHGYFHFDVPSLPTDWPAVSEWPRVAVAQSGDLLATLFHHVLAWAEKGDGEMIRQTIGLMLRTHLVGQRSSNDLPTELHPEAVQRAIDLVYARLDADPSAELSLDDLADHACVTPEHLARLFKRSTKRSPMTFVRMARLDRALLMLTRTNYSIGQIANLCGFVSQFHFARLFRAAFGDTPSSVRQRSREGGTPPLPTLLRQTRLPLPDQKQA